VAIIFEIQITQTLRQPLLDLVCFRPECPSWLKKKTLLHQLVCIENLLLRSHERNFWGNTGGEKGASNACPTIYGIAAIVANCKCCGKQVNWIYFVYKLPTAAGRGAGPLSSVNWPAGRQQSSSNPHTNTYPQPNPNAIPTRRLPIGDKSLPDLTTQQRSPEINSDALEMWSFGLGLCKNSNRIWQIHKEC